MRDHLVFFINGQRFAISGETAFCSLADFLRSHLHLAGTKVVCAEGDCGACTVLVGKLDGDRLRYEVVDACILFLYQLDGKQVVTVEGLRGNGQLHPVQQAMVTCHGSQCGYCTPGFVMTMVGLFHENRKLDPQELRQGLTGNLCRCTGYVPILEAGLSMEEVEPSLADLVPSADGWRHVSEPVFLRTERRTFFQPHRLQEALDFKAEHPAAVIVSGNTELGVLRNKRNLDPPTLLSLTAIRELADLVSAMDSVSIGANVTWTQIEHWAKDLLPEFYKIIVRFGSPQIRNVSTLAGNVANGSPIADSLPFLYVMGAEVELARSDGARRVRIDRFYHGYKKKDLAPDEIITHVHLPLPAKDDRLRLYKVSRRNDLDIATFGAAIRVRCDRDQIAEAHVAYAGVAPTVVRLAETEDFLQGKPFADETFAEAGRIARTEIDPITDVRGSREYRLQLAENILQKFYFDCSEPSRSHAPRGNGSLDAPRRESG